MNKVAYPFLRIYIQMNRSKMNIHLHFSKISWLRQYINKKFLEACLKFQSPGKYDAGTVAESLHLKPTNRIEREIEQNKMDIWNPKAHHHCVPPTRLCIPILPKQFYQLGSNYSNTWAYKNQSHSFKQPHINILLYIMIKNN